MLNLTGAAWVWLFDQFHKNTKKKTFLFLDILIASTLKTCKFFELVCQVSKDSF